MSLLAAAEALARAHHAQYDSSHDFHHAHRVRLQSLLIARSLPSSPDLLVVELSALFHDLLDAKYLPAGTRTTPRELLGPFWAERGEGVSEERRRLVEEVVGNVSYSKEVKRVEKGQETEWHRSCQELHCVQDADKLDAIGAFGILRCAAYSGASGVPLFVPPSTSPSSTATGKSSAIDHFHEKLFNLEGMMKTEKGKELARARTAFMRTFVEQMEREWSEIEGGM